MDPVHQRQPRRPLRRAVAALLGGLAICAASCSTSTKGTSSADTTEPVITTTTTADTAATGSARCDSRARSAELEDVRVDGALDRRWISYALSDRGWTGGDSVYAYDLGHSRMLWTFADSYVRDLEPGDQRKGGIFHNLFVVAAGSAFRVLVGGTTARPENLVGPRNGRIFDLSLGGIVEPSTFQELFTIRRRVGGESLDHVPVGGLIATFSRPSLRLLRTVAVAGPADKVTWGSSVDLFGGYSYIYGASAFGVEKSGFVARTHGRDLDLPWQYWDGAGWSPRPAAAAPILRPVSQEFSVTPVEGMYLLLTTDSTAPFSPLVDVYFGCSPVGPFRRSNQFRTSDLVGPLGLATWDDANVYDYDAKVQPALGQPGELVISYDQNSLNFLAILAHAAIYRPRYLEATVVLGDRR